MNRAEKIIIGLILLIAICTRLYKIDRPLADWHSWRQADTAAVSRNFIKEGFNPFIPKFDDMSSQTNGLDNPKRYRMVEFPIYNLIVAAVWQVTGIDTIFARLTTVVITLGSTLLLYLLVRFLSSWQTAAIASFIFATLPFNVFYSSAILPGPLMVFGILGLYVSFIKWLQNKNWLFFLLSIFFANLAILTWPIAIFFFLPLMYLSFEKYGFKMLKMILLWVFVLAALMPFIAWRVWILRFPEGIPSWQFLINEGNIRFKGAFFRWIIAERLGKLILTTGGFTLFILGILKKPQNKEKYFYIAWLLSTITYFTVFASGNVRHDYYQVPAIPIFAIFMAKGIKTLFNPQKNLYLRLTGPFIAVFLLLSTYALAIFEVRGLYWINRPEIIAAGQAADRLLPRDATVIAPYNGDVAFLYQTNRHGYPIVDRQLAEFVSLGTKYLVSVDVNDQGIQKLTQDCKVIEKTTSYVIVELFKECI